MQQTLQLNKAVFSSLGCPLLRALLHVAWLFCPHPEFSNPKSPAVFGSWSDVCLGVHAGFSSCPLGAASAWVLCSITDWQSILRVLYLLLLFLPGEIAVGKRSSVRVWCCSRVPLKSPPVYNVSYMLSRAEELRAEKEILEVGWDAFGCSCRIWEAHCREGWIVQMQGWCRRKLRRFLDHHGKDFWEAGRYGVGMEESCESQYREKILLVLLLTCFVNFSEKWVASQWETKLSLRHRTTVALPSIMFYQRSEQCHYHLIQCWWYAI